MTCKMCDRFWDDFWVRSDAWERSVSNDTELFSDETHERRALIQSACKVDDTDPASAFRIFVEAAEAGSVWSMEMAGWHCLTGTGVDADEFMALDYYYRAACGGSRMATVAYARLLAESGHYDDSEAVLKNAVASDFAPAFFWLGWIRYKRSKTAKVAREVRPLLDYPARQGHPGAKVTLVRWMALGKLGLLEVPRGWTLLVRDAVRFASNPNEVALADDWEMTSNETRSPPST